MGTPHVARPILGEREAPERAPSREARLDWLHAAFLEFALFHRAVELNFFGQIGLEPALPDRVPDAANELSHGPLTRY